MGPTTSSTSGTKRTPGKRERLQEHPVDDAEDGGGGAGGERKREHGHAGESRRLAQRPGGKAHIVPKGVDSEHEG
jgi:hypothetical protein